MIRVKVSLKKNIGPRPVIEVTAKNELDFSSKITELMKKHGAYGFSRENTTTLTLVDSPSDNGNE